MAPQFCKIENEMFSVKDLNKMLEQLYKKESENTYCCLKCSTTKNTKCDMEEHAKIHVNELSFKCELCDKFFNTTPNLRNHTMRSHN